MRLPVPLVVAVAAALAVPALARADLADERALAERFAPVVRLVEQVEECGPGESWEPTDVDVLFDEPTVALRGPWNPSDLVEIGPSADDLVDRFEYHLDFPGNPLHPGCDYERWARRLTADHAPTVYAHVATDPGSPGEVALQYWLFYPFNEFNNLHEGDWEMVQLVFEADDARAALEREPVSVGYSSHEGAEEAEWGEEKLEVVDGTHPVVYPADGSHANKFTEALYIGSSAEAGVGCDDTRGPHVELRPDVVTIPSDADAARRAYPWIGFEGRWGELQPAFFNGPTGPNLKTQWTAPIEWADDWRPRSYAVPTGGILGTGATDFFCDAVATGSKGLVQLLNNPVPMVLLLGALLAVAVYAGTRTEWRPPLRSASRAADAGARSSPRRGGCTSRGRRCSRRSACCSSRWASSSPWWRRSSSAGSGLLGIETTGETAGWLALLVLAVGATLTLLGVGLVQAATACAVVEIDEGRSVGPLDAYRLALTRIRPLLGGLAIAVAVCVSWRRRRSSFPSRSGSPCAGRCSRRRSSWKITRAAAGCGEVPSRAGRWLRVASLVGLSAALALAVGPFLGAVLDLRHRGAARVAERRRGHRLRARDAVRRARHVLRLRRRPRARRARAHRGVRELPAESGCRARASGELRRRITGLAPDLQRTSIAARSRVDGNGQSAIRDGGKGARRIRTGGVRDVSREDDERLARRPARRPPSASARAHLSARAAPASPPQLAESVGNPACASVESSASFLYSSSRRVEIAARPVAKICQTSTQTSANAPIAPAVAIIASGHPVAKTDTHLLLVLDCLRRRGHDLGREADGEWDDLEVFIALPSSENSSVPVTTPAASSRCRCMCTSGRLRPTSRRAG